MNVILLIGGLALILLGAQFLVDGSVAVAKRYKMSEFLIGITIVGIGTSMPELVTSLFGALAGKGDIAIGNVVGSNIANTFLILGVTALIRPIYIEKSALRRDIPVNIGLSVLLLILCFGFAFWKESAGRVITRAEGLLLLAIFAGYMALSFGNSKKDNAARKTAPPSTEARRPITMWLAVIMIMGGLAALVFGGRFFVNGAVGIARTLGVSESVIAITILALGTSLPELATSVVAAIKNNTQLAFGNVIGSNISNIALILGVSATARPLQIVSISRMDIYMMIFSSLVMLISVYSFKKHRLDRWEGTIFLLIYIAYIYLTATGRAVI